METIKTLLAIELYEITGKELSKFDGELYDLHEFYLDEKGHIKQFDYVEFVDDDKFITFNANTSDSILHEEISNCGLEELLSNIDMRPFFDKMIKSDTQEILPTTNYLVINLKYRTYNDSNGCDTELDVSIDKVLDLYNIK